MDGSMYWHDGHTHGGPSGWVFPWDRRDPRLAPPYRWTSCPCCGGTLPTMTDSLLRALREESAWQRFVREVFRRDEGEGPE